MPATSVMSAYSLYTLATQMNNGELMTVIEVLTKVNEILDHLPWFEANNVASHIVSRRKNLPTGSTRKINAGVLPSVTYTGKTEEAIKLLEDYSVVDKVLALMSGNKEAYLSSQDSAFLEGLSQTLVSDIFYGDRDADPDSITGLANRDDYNNLDSNYVYDNAGGATPSVTANKTSLWILSLGDLKVNMRYPKGNPTLGVERHYLGEQTWSDPADAKKKFQAFVTHFKANYGIVIEDPRCVRRLANISTTNIDGVDDFTLNDDYIVNALEDMPAGDKIIVCNGTVKAMLNIIAKDKINVHWPAEHPFGRAVTNYCGVPVIKTEAITNTEGRITS